MRNQKISCWAIMIVWGLSFCALPVTSCMAGHFACAFQRQLAAWENSAGTGCIGGHVCRVWVWDEDGKPIPNIQLYTTWGVLMGATDIDGRAEIPMWGDDYNLKCVDGHGSTSDATRLMTTHRPECWGHYSFEVGFLYKTDASNPGEFDLDLNCTWNERAPAPQDNDAPYTKSLAYRGVDCTDYWSDQSHWGNWQNPPSYFGQTFIATGDRVVAARVQGTIGGLNLLGWKLRIVTFPALQPVGQDTSVPVRWPFGWEAFWGVNDCPVVPGQKYMLQVWRDGGGMNIYHVTDDVYPDGHYYEGTTPFPQFDLNGHICCMNYSRPSILYVDASVSPGGDGRSWANAYNDLQDALAAAQPGVEIRVAQGIYSPEGTLLNGRQASNPNPPDGAGISNLDADLSWTPGPYATSHDVYFGTTSPGIFQGNQIATTFDPGTMAMGTKYYWRIDEVGPSGTTTGAIWSFTMLSPPPPPPLANSNELAAPVVIDRETTFQLKNGVVIKGGYAGFGEPEPNERDPNIYETILSGDIGILGYNSDNCYHVVTSKDCDANTILDGFTITSGNANGISGITEGMISHWKFDEGQGSIAYDSAGKNHGTVIGAEWTLRSIDGALSFDGMNDYVLIPNESNFDATDQITVAAWIKVNMFNRYWQAIVTKGDNAWRLHRYQDTSSVAFHCSDQWGGWLGADGSVNVNDGKWHHLTGVYDGLKLYLYVDGALDASVNAPWTINTNNYPVLIGENAGHRGRYWNGLIDDVRIYERSLSAEEIQRLFITTGENRKFGGGMFNKDSSPRINNCTFSANQAEQCGGGIYNDSSSPVLTNCRFNGNFSNSRGGGITNEGYSNPKLVNCLFSGNSADNGGGMDNRMGSNPTLINCTFSGNSARESGGGMDNDQSRPVLNNCILWSNRDDSGMGVSAQISGAVILNYSCVQGYFETVIQGMISHWPFDEAGGTTAYDSAGSNHGTVYGAEWTTGLIDKALSFDGVDDYVEIADSSSLDCTGGITIVMWIKPYSGMNCDENNNWRYILRKGDSVWGAYNLIYEASWDAPLISFRVIRGQSEYGLVTTSAAFPGSFAFLAFTYDAVSREQKAYFNGNLDSQTMTAGGPISRKIGPLKIGGGINTVVCPDGAGSFKGLIDDVAIYDRALSAEEIQRLFITTGVNKGNINTDPCFVSPGYWDANGVWVDGNYHLLPYSACINTGDPDYIAEPNETDLDDNPRIIGAAIDMGAYELQNTPPFADAGPDQTVDAQAPWGATVTLDGSGSSDADSTPDTIDDINDFNWYEIDPCDPNADVFLGSGEIIDCNLSIGEHIIVLEVIDKAGASDTDQVTIIVQDTTLPVFTSTPQDLIVECDGNSNLDELNAWLASAAAVDECGDVTITNDFLGLLNGCGATGSATVTWTAEDESGNITTTPPATFTIVDTIPPVITCPPDVTLQCPADTSIETNGSATAGETCATVTITHSDQWQPGCGNTGTLIRTWTATDDCGNSSSCVQTLTVVDTTPPVITCPPDVTLQCPADTSVEANGSATAVDTCATVTITHSDQWQSGCGSTGTLIRTWTATDDCGNSSSCVQTLTVVDATPPAITCPADVTLECPADTSVEANGSATAGDTCGSVAITHSDLWQPGCGNTGILTRTWTATDECGNSASCVQTLTVVDTTPPEFTFSVTPTMLWPPDHRMVLITPSWTVSDECDATPDVSLVSIIANEGDDTIGDGHTSNDIQIGEEGSIYLRSERSGTNTDRVYTITYQAVDDCGNTTLRSAVVSIPHDFKVLARIAAQWLWAGPGRIPEDLNGDGFVNLKDIAIFANNWIQ